MPEGLKGTTGGFAAAVATGAITALSTTAGSAIVVGGVIVGLVTSEPQKDIALSSAQIAYIQQYAPEYYQENRNNIVVKDSPNSKELSKEEESKLLSTLSNYYKTSKTPDEKLAYSTGLTVGGAIGAKVGSAEGEKIKDILPKKSQIQSIRGVFENGKEYKVIQPLKGKIKSTNEILTLEGQAKLKNMTVEEIHTLFKNEGLNVQKVIDTKGTGIGEKFTILGNKKNGIGSIRSNINGAHSSKYIVISTDNGNIKVIFDSPQNYISNLSNVEKASLIFVDDKLGR